VRGRRGTEEKNQLAFAMLLWGGLRPGIESGGEPAAVQTLRDELATFGERDSVWTAVVSAPLSRVTFSGQTVLPNAKSKT
jgi:hypothetical protein